MKAIALDTETTGSDFLYGVDTPFVLYGMDNDGHRFKWEWKFNPVKRRSIPDIGIARDIESFTDGYDLLVFHNSKFDIRALQSLGVNLNWKGKLFDTQIASHVLNNISEHKLKVLARQHLLLKNDEEKIIKSEVAKARRIARKEFPRWVLGDKEKGGKEGNETKIALDYWIFKAIARKLKYPRKHPWWTLCDKYGYGDVLRTIELYHLFESGLNVEELWKPYNREIEFLEESLYELEGKGVNVLNENLEESLQEFMSERDVVGNRLKEISTTNWKSPKDLPTFLYGTPLRKVNPETGKEESIVLIKDEPKFWSDLSANEKRYGKKSPIFSSRKGSLKLDPLKFTDAGGLSADRKTLESLLKGKLNIKQKKYLSDLIDWKDVDKAVQQLETIQGHVLKGSVLYFNIKQNGTKTVRVSASNPNPQQISKGREYTDEDGVKIVKYKIRRVFGPAPGRVWYCIDYSQLQLRIFAYVANEKSLVKYFDEGEDAHAYVASVIFNKPIGKITSHERRIAKNVNFGFIFGASPKKIEATAGMDGLWGTVTSMFPSAHSFMNATKRQVLNEGFVYTPYGYKLHLPYENGKPKSHAGVNYIIQGCEGDIVKNAMIDVSQYMRSKQFRKDSGLKTGDAFMCLQVHDELVFDFPEYGNHDKPLKRICNLMEMAGEEVGMYTPVDVERTTTNWADCQKYTLAS